MHSELPTQYITKFSFSIYEYELHGIFIFHKSASALRLIGCLMSTILLLLPSEQGKFNCPNTRAGR
jgi:hypothetical protein